jgi:hypothetical protein
MKKGKNQFTESFGLISLTSNPGAGAFLTGSFSVSLAFLKVSIGLQIHSAELGLGLWGTCRLCPCELGQVFFSKKLECIIRCI